MVSSAFWNLFEIYSCQFHAIVKIISSMDSTDTGGIDITFQLEMP